MKVPFEQRYRLLKELERNSCVTSYIAYDESYGLEVEVDAIEVDKCGHTGLIERLRQLLAPATHISSPHAASLFDWREEEGRLYLVRERAEGQTLARILSEAGELPRQQVAQIARAVTEVLTEAYGKGVFYLGLNPAQVRVDARGEPRVIRAGYGWILEELDPALSTRVSSYRAPEADGGTEGARISDVYSLAMMIKEMLPGHAGSDRLQSLLERSLDPMPSHRPSSPRLLLEELEATKDETARGVGDPGAGLMGDVAPETENEDNFLKADSLLPYLSLERPRRHPLRSLLLMLLGGLIVWLLFAAIAGSLDGGKKTQTATVQGGQQEVNLPDLEGVPSEDAQKLLTRLGLMIELREVPSRLWSAGVVAAQEPAMGSVLRQGDLVCLAISSGPDDSADPSLAQTQGQDTVPASVPADTGLTSPASGPSAQSPSPGNNSQQAVPEEQKPAPLSPRAVPTVSSRRGPAPLYVVLDGGSSYDPDGNIARYVWECGDGTILEGVRAQHVYDPPVIPACFRISLQVFDNQGLSSSSSLTVEVY